MIKRKVLVNLFSTTFYQDDIRIKFLQEGTQEGIRKSIILFKHLQSMGHEIILMTNFELNSTDFDIFNIIKINSPEDAFIKFKKLNPEIGIIWNGSDSADKIVESWFKNLNAKIFYLEYGFFPQNQHIRLSTGGVLGAAKKLPLSFINDIRRDSLLCNLSSLRSKYKDKTVTDQAAVLVLQTDNDSSIVMGSPYTTMMSFLMALKKKNFDFSTVNIRFHPLMPLTTKESLIENFNLSKIDQSASTSESLSSHDFFLGVNSTMLYEAALLGKKVINFGSVHLDYSRDFYSGFDFLDSGFVLPFWDAESSRRDLSLMTLYQFKQFNLHSISPSFSDYLDFLIETTF